MEESKQRKNEQAVGEQNPTLNAPGSQVSDYGNVQGGTGTEDERSQRTTDKADRSNIEPLQPRQNTGGEQTNASAEGAAATERVHSQSDRPEDGGNEPNTIGIP